MFATALWQMGFASSTLSGRQFRMNDIARLVDDLRATLEEFGAPGDGAGEMFFAPDPKVWRDLTQRRLRRTMPR